MVIDRSVPVLRHVGIVVSDMDRALAIYRDFLGLEVKADYKDLHGDYFSRLVDIEAVRMRIAILRLPDNNRIELLEYRSARGARRDPVESNDIGASHFAISVTDMDAMYARARSFDVRFLSKPLTSPDGSAKVAYAVLMEECIVELVEVLKDSARYSGGA